MVVGLDDVNHKRVVDSMRAGSGVSANSNRRYGFLGMGVTRFLLFLGAKWLSCPGGTRPS